MVSEVFYMGSIYMIVNKINNKKYIGQTCKSVTRRFNEHLRAAIHNTHRYLYHAINKYGPENFEIIELEKDIPIELLDEKEQYYINKYNTYNDGYNLTLGGNGVRGWHHSDETKKQISKSVHSKFDIIFTEDRAKKISKALKGRPKSLEHRKHISETRLQNPTGFCGEANGFYGKHHSKESKLKMSNSSIKYNVIQLDKDKQTIINKFKSAQEAAKYMISENKTNAKLSSVLYRIYMACESENICTYNYYWKYEDKV